MKPLVTMRHALEDRDLFGAILSGPTWASWRVLLIAAMGEEMTADERITFEQLTGRPAEPGERVDEWFSVIGRRGGKTRAIAVLGSYIAGLCDWSDYLAPGERCSLPIMSASTWQASKALQYLNGIFAEVPAMAELVESQTADTISLRTRVDIEVRPASFRTARGGTLCAAICDELALWRSDQSANPDTEILNAIRPGLGTTGGMLIAISSPYARRGELYNTWKRHYGPNGDPSILVAKAASRTMNPSLSQRVVDRAYERDPAAAAAEFGGEFRTDVESFVSRETVDAAVVPGRRELPPVPGVAYFAGTDPSGGSADSFTLGIAHAEGNAIILDCVRVVTPPFSPESVAEEFAETVRSYGVSSVTGDRYGGEWPREQFRKHGVEYALSEKPASDNFRDLLPLLNSGRVELLDHDKLVSELCNLERRTARGGRDSISHPPGLHDDIIASAAIAIVLASSEQRPMLVRQEDLLQDGSALPLPSPCRMVIAVMTADASGKTATIYSAVTFAGARLNILDYHVGPLHGGLFETIGARLRDLAGQCRSRAAALFVPQDFVARVRTPGLVVNAIPEHLCADELLLPAAAHISAGNVKICTLAQAKAATSPFSAALNFRAAEKADDPLRQAALLAITLTLDPQ